MSLAALVALLLILNTGIRMVAAAIAPSTTTDRNPR